jgi:hypothetical protein
MRQSVSELARGARKVLLFGNGGGGDVIQAVPVANQLRQLGVEEVIFGGVSCAWQEDGVGVPTDSATVLVGAWAYPLEELTHTTRLGESLVEVSPETRLRGQMIGEVAVRTALDTRTVVIGLRGGVPRAVRDLQAFVEREGVDLVMSCDVGSDSFFNGREPHPAHTCLVDFMSLGVLTGLRGPTVFGLGGYGCDGELLPEDLERNVGVALRHGGFLGAFGVTQRDAVDMEAAFALYHDPIGTLVLRALKGEFGWTTVRTTGPWGHPVRVTPLATVTLFFDPHVLAEHVCVAVPQLAEAQSIEEAEVMYEEIFGLPPETRLVRVARMRAPQVEPAEVV